MEQNAPQGFPIEIIIKIKPEPQQRTDLRIYENKISLLDQYDRANEEFITNGAILENSDAIRNTFDETIGKNINAVVHGINYTIFTFGGKGTGKSFTLEGSQTESGINSLLIENLFRALEAKRDDLIQEMQNVNVPDVEATSYTFSVRMKYVAIRDEGIVDLLQKYNNYKQPAQLVYSEHEGYTVNGAAWVGLSSSMNFPDIYADGSKFRAPFVYNNINKETALLIFEITQTLDNRATRESQVIRSRINIFDLPSADVLTEQFRNLSNSLENKSLFAFNNMIGDLAKSNNNSLPTIFENSALTKLMKESIGGNSICTGIFTLMNNNYTLSSISFKVMKLCSRILNFPIMNDANALALLKKFRTDISYYSKFKGAGGSGYEMRPPIISKGLNELQTQPNIQMGGNPMDQDPNQGRLNFLEKENARLADHFKELEETNMNLQKALSLTKTQQMTQQFDPMSQMQQPFNPMNQMGPPYMPDRYDVNDKVAHLENDIVEMNDINETVVKLNEKFKILEGERRVLAEEVENLRANKQNITNELDKIQSDARNQHTNLTNEIFNTKELLNSTKNELDYMRNEAEKYRKMHADVLLEIDEREVQYKKQLEDKEREIEMKMLDLSQNEKRRLEAENREATRKLEHYGEENADFISIIEELKKDNNNLSLQANQMRSTLRDALSNDNKTEMSKSDKMKLMDTYNEREDELKKLYELEKNKKEDLKQKLARMRTYARKARNIALDYFPHNEELPEILTKDLNNFFENAENESVIQFLEFEIRTLRERNKKVEYENTRLREEFRIGPNNSITMNTLPKKTMMNTNMGRSGGAPLVEEQLTEKQVGMKLLEEVMKLTHGLYTNNNPQGNVANVSASNFANAPLQKEVDRLKRENLKLSEENKRLKTLINDNSVQDTINTRDNDNPKAMQMKITYLEKAIEQLEKERSELNTRCTMAEEQLKNFQEMYNTTTQEYQKKILALNHRVNAQNTRITNNYMNNNFDDL